MNSSEIKFEATPVSQPTPIPAAPKEVSKSSKNNPIPWVDFVRVSSDEEIKKRFASDA